MASRDSLEGQIRRLQEQVAALILAAGSVPRVRGIAPMRVSESGWAGASLHPAAEDHTHEHGKLPGGSFHALVSEASPGFMSPQQLADLRALAASTAATVQTLTIDAPLANGGTPQNPIVQIPLGSLGNAYLTNSQITLTPGAGLTGGGAVSLGGSGGLALPTVGAAGTYAYPTSVTTDVYGRVASVTGGSAPVSSLTVNAPLSDSGTPTAPIIEITPGAISNTYLANSQITLTPGAGLTGGGAVALGGSGGLALPTVGAAGTYAYPASVTTDAYGRLTAVTPGSGPAPTADVQLFAGAGTWNKPSGAFTWADLFLIGPGGGGGSGRRGNSPRSGGGGGGGGGFTHIRLLISSLPASVSVNPGVAGSGAIAIAADNTNGQAGQPGFPAAQFGSIARADGGLAGAGGGTTTAAGGGGGAAAFPGGAGGTGQNGLGLSPPRPAHGAGGGGGGGGTNAAGGDGAAPASSNLNVGGFGGLSGSPGSNGNAAVGALPGTGGGGGGGSNAGPGGNGGNGGGYGSGGGGGGGAPNGQLSGAGGAGGPGLVLVVCS